ncbi:hypothetical protein ACFFMN_23060 [Planobispora siamensis]|uniref:Minor tail protein n=1 Tax=Planobispora siamensis TaxID=936338 RepID=A0A8J3WMX7_9ACTN|nr:hypothetical protein [Planobispora siamensis]GIH95448.1 hypothetical protein Psi01_60780 [Planobispora siamensis]
MATYRYLFYDFSTRRLIDALPMDEVSFSWELRGVGTFTGQIPLYADELPAARVLEAVQPYRTKIFAERDGGLVWGGWIHQEPSYDSSTGKLTVSAEESLGYFARRTMPSVVFSGVDQLTIARSFLTTAQAEPGGDMWIAVDPSVLSGRLRDRSYSQYDQSPVLTALTQLSEVIDGFDFSTQVGWVGGLPHELLVLGYPRLGRTGKDSGLVFEFDRFSGSGGNIDSYTWGDAGVPMSTRTWANSETDEGVQLTARSERPDLIADGYPVMENSESFDGVVNGSTLQTHADALQDFRSAPRVVAQFTLVAGAGVDIGDFGMGDEVLVRLSDWRHPPNPTTGAPGYLNYLRITGCAVAPGVQGAERLTFTCADFAAA